LFEEVATTDGVVLGAPAEDVVVVETSDTPVEVIVVGADTRVIDCTVLDDTTVDDTIIDTVDNAMLDVVTVADKPFEDDLSVDAVDAVDAVIDAMALVSMLVDDAVIAVLGIVTTNDELVDIDLEVLDVERVINEIVCEVVGQSIWLSQVQGD